MRVTTRGRASTRARPDGETRSPGHGPLATCFDRVRRPIGPPRMGTRWTYRPGRPRGLVSTNQPRNASPRLLTPRLHPRSLHASRAALVQASPEPSSFHRVPPQREGRLATAARRGDETRLAQRVRATSAPGTAETSEACFACPSRGVTAACRPGRQEGDSRVGHELEQEYGFRRCGLRPGISCAQGVESVAPWQFAPLLVLVQDTAWKEVTLSELGRNVPERVLGSCLELGAAARGGGCAPLAVPVEPAGYDELGAVDVAVLLEQRARCGLETASLFMSKSRRSSSLRVTSISRWPSLPAPRLPSTVGSHAPRARHFPAIGCPGPGIVDPD